MILNRIEKKIVEGFAKKQRPRNMISVGPFNMVIRDHGITIIPLLIDALETRTSGSRMGQNHP